MMLPCYEASSQQNGNTLMRACGCLSVPKLSRNLGFAMWDLELSANCQKSNRTFSKLSEVVNKNELQNAYEF